ncbi:hypothetical protein ACSBR1_031364 [Camellia fascicularis]
MHTWAKWEREQLKTLLSSCRMRHMIMNYSLLPTLILAFYFVCSNHVLAQYFIKFRVHIISAVPDDPTPLLIHCQSKDDDLDYHFLSNGQDFDWKFRKNFFGTTLFFCAFQWNSKFTSFDVFNKTTASDCETPEQPWTCVWVVKPDGFYMENSDSNGTKLNTW